MFMTTRTLSADARFIEKLYRDVPPVDREAFHRFRIDNPVRRAMVRGVEWEYLTGGEGDRNLLLLPGAQGTGASIWANAEHFSHRFRWVAPSYPPLATMAELTDGVTGLLDHLGMPSAAVIGGSYGGFVAQVLVRRHPERVERLLLSHTGPPRPLRGRQIAGALRWLRFLPLSALRAQYRKVMMGLVPDRPELALTRAYLEELIALRVTRQGLLAGYRRVIDFDAMRFAPEDLDGWSGRVLLLMADDDPATPEPVRRQMRNLYPRAEVSLFAGSGHATGALLRDEYLAAMDAFLE
jgi:pimeloyl-ACP methyl ester carboxylesterase